MHFSHLSADLILLILDAADPESLLQFCRVISTAHVYLYEHICLLFPCPQACKWVQYMVMETTSLRYRVELVLAGMKDGYPSQYLAHIRLEQLLSFKKSWPTLSWSKEEEVNIKTPNFMGVSGGFFYHARQRTSQQYHWILEFYELRSYRIGRPNPNLQHYKFDIRFEVKSVVIDPSQNLLILVELNHSYE